MYEVNLFLTDNAFLIDNEYQIGRMGVQSKEADTKMELLIYREGIYSDQKEGYSELTNGTISGAVIHLKDHMSHLSQSRMTSYTII